MGAGGIAESKVGEELQAAGPRLAIKGGPGARRRSLPPPATCLPPAQLPPSLPPSSPHPAWPQVLTPSDDVHHINKHAFKVPFVCGCRDLGEALRRIAEGAAMIRTKVRRRGCAPHNNLQAWFGHATLQAFFECATSPGLPPLLICTRFSPVARHSIPSASAGRGGHRQRGGGCAARARGAGRHPPAADHGR